MVAPQESPNKDRERRTLCCSTLRAPIHDVARRTQSDWRLEDISTPLETLTRAGPVQRGLACSILRPTSFASSFCFGPSPAGSPCGRLRAGLGPEIARALPSPRHLLLVRPGRQRLGGNRTSVARVRLARRGEQDEPATFGHVVAECPDVSGPASCFCARACHTMRARHRDEGVLVV